MRKNKFSKLASMALAISLAASPMATSAHGGRTDSNGGHRDNKNASGLGSYHYHCGGNPAHLHTNGCPYTSKKSSTKSTSSKAKATSKSNESLKAVQTKLNSLGYDCGTPDGLNGKKTKAAIKKFQADNGLKADGIAGKNTKAKMGL